jgi:hypothetical protein
LLETFSLKLNDEEYDFRRHITTSRLQLALDRNQCRRQRGVKAGCAAQLYLKNAIGTMTGLNMQRKRRFKV